MSIDHTRHSHKILDTARSPVRPGVKSIECCCAYIDLGPIQNGHIGRPNGRLGDECLNANWFLDLRLARKTQFAGEATTTELALKALSATNPNGFAPLPCQRQA